MADPATVFAALAEIIYQGSDPGEVYAAICIAATLVVSGCDHASLLVRRDSRYVTVGASDRVAQRVDRKGPERNDNNEADANTVLPHLVDRVLDRAEHGPEQD